MSEPVWTGEHALDRVIEVFGDQPEIMTAAAGERLGSHILTVEHERDAAETKASQWEEAVGQAELRIIGLQDEVKELEHERDALEQDNGILQSACTNWQERWDSAVAERDAALAVVRELREALDSAQWQVNGVCVVCRQPIHDEHCRVGSALARTASLGKEQTK